MVLEGAYRDAVGISLQMVATFLAALAYVMQKQAHIETSGTKGEKRSVFRHRKWIIGFGLMVLVAGVDVYSFSLLDQSKQAAMGAVTLAWNTILAACFLRESFTVLDFISVIIIMSGTITGLSNASAESADFTFREIVGLLDDTFVYVYSSIVALFLICTAYFVETTSRTPRSSWTHSRSRALALLSPFLGGMFMGFTGYGTKALSTVVFNGEWVEFKDGELYAYLLMTGVSVSMQVRYLNKGLEFFDAMRVVPIFQSAIIFSNAMAGIVYYHDMRTAPAWKLLMFALGGAMCIFGISLLLLKTHKPKGMGHEIPIKEIERQRTMSSSSSRKLGRSPSEGSAADAGMGAGAGSASSSHLQISIHGAHKGGSGANLGGAGGAGGGLTGSDAGAGGASAQPTGPIWGSGNGTGIGMGAIHATPGTPLLMAARKPGGSRKSSSGSSLALAAGSAGAGGATPTPIEGETVSLTGADSLASGARHSSSRGHDISRLSPSAGSRDSAGNEEIGGVGSGSEEGAGAGGGGGGRDSAGFTRPRSSTSTRGRRIRETLGIETPVVETAAVEMVAEWPEPPLGAATGAARKDESGGGGGGGGATPTPRPRVNTADTAGGAGPVAVEHWWDMEVGAAVRLVWRRVRGSRYAALS
jgi:hypothetical protein